MKTNLLRASFAVASVQLALASVASAHPGPIGHTHDDEWPFGTVALLLFAAGVSLVGGLRMALSKRG